MGLRENLTKFNQAKVYALLCLTAASGTARSAFPLQALGKLP